MSIHTSPTTGFCPKLITYLNDSVPDYGSIQRKTWHLVNKKVFSTKNDLNKYLQETYHIKTRTANSIISDMEGRHKSLLELKKHELEELDIRIARKEGEIKEIKEFLDVFAPQAAANMLKGKDLETYRNKKRALHEHKEKLNCMKNQRINLQKEIDTGVLSICFGTKALFRKQYELEKSNFSSHEEWLQAFRKNRDKNLYYLARGEETFGNQMCHLTPTDISDDIFNITVFDSEKGQKVAAKGQVRFSYCLPELRRQLQWHQEKSVFSQPISARFVKRGEDWYLILSLNVQKMPVYTNKRSDGVVSLDFNYSFIVLTELDHHGNIINKFRIDIPHAGKGAQGLHETRIAIKKAVQYAALVQKPLAVEDLDFTKKRAKLLKKRAIRYNEMLSSLNYGQYKQALIRRCQKDGVELIVVKPAGTTQTGKKYMEAMHLTGHEAAAWQIGRRAMGFWLNSKKSVKQQAYEKKARQDVRKKAKAKAKAKQAQARKTRTRQTKPRKQTAKKGAATAPKP